MTESRFEELDLTLEDDLTLQDSSAVDRGQETAGRLAPSSGSSSFIDLGGKEEDDLVLGGSGHGKRRHPRRRQRHLPGRSVRQRPVAGDAGQPGRGARRIVGAWEDDGAPGR